MKNTKIKEKRDRFKKLASSRTNMVLKSLKVLGNCSNRSAYEYSEEEIQRIFKEIEVEVRNTKSKFHYKRSKKFRL